MIVPADRHYFDNSLVFDTASLGDVFEIDSGLGGSHMVVFRGKTKDGEYHFHRPPKDDWPEANFRFDKNVTTSVYILLPEDPTFLEWNMEMVCIHGTQYVVDRVYGIVWVENTEGYFRIKRKRWSIASLVESILARQRTGISRKNR